MSTYQVNEPNAVSNTLDIYGPDGRVIGQIYGADDTESLRFKHFIEDYDEIVITLRGAMHVLGPKDCYTPIIEKLINRIEGEEAQ